MNSRYLIIIVLLLFCKTPFNMENNKNRNGKLQETRIVFGLSIDSVEIGDSQLIVERKLGPPTSIILGDFAGFLYEYKEGEHAGIFVTISIDSLFGGLIGVLQVKVEAPYSGTTKDGVGIGTDRDVAKRFVGTPTSSSNDFDRYDFDRIMFGITYDQNKILSLIMERKSW